jgi:hypothetical protein
VANDANALGTMARVKERIMLSGGVIASMAMSGRTFKQFLAFKGPVNAVVTANESLAGTAFGHVVMHAVFCYGWWDNPNNLEDGWWLCKNRWADSGPLVSTVPVKNSLVWLYYALDVRFGQLTVTIASADTHQSRNCHCKQGRLATPRCLGCGAEPGKVIAAAWQSSCPVLLRCNSRTRAC